MPTRRRNAALCVHLALVALAVLGARSSYSFSAPTFNIPRRDFFQAVLLVPAAEAEEVRVYSETDNLGEVWTTASVLERRAKELEKLSQRKPERSAPLPRAFVTYLTRVLINYDRRSGKLWEASAPTSAASTAEARRAQFAALAAAVDLGIIGAYGNDAEGLLSLAKALRGLCRDNMAAKRQVAFALSLLPSNLQPTEVIARLIEDFTAALDFVDIPSSDLNEAAAATDAELRALRSKSLADRLAQLIPDGLCMPELVRNGTSSADIYYRPQQQALLAAAALSSLEVNLDGGEGFGVGSFAASELPAFDRPASLDPLFGPFGQSPLARARALDISQYLRLAVSGAVCSAVVRAVLQPLEVVKITQQLSPRDPKTVKSQGVIDEFVATAKDLMKEDGVLALYRGTGSTILATSVMGFTSFGLNEFFRRSLEKFSGDPFGETGAVIVLAASISSVFVSAILACPFETLRVRVMAPAEKRSFQDIAAEAAGKLSALWAGLVPFWAREIPFSACKFLVFDLASRAFFVIFPSAAGDGSSLGISALAGAIAGVASAVVSNPADVVITQISSAGEDKGRASLGSLDLWKGLGARCVYFAAAICAQFLIYDTVKELLGVSTGDLRLVLDVFGISAKAESLLG